MSGLNPPVDAEQDEVEIYQKSYATALRLLARREHSMLELQHKLSGRKFPDAVVGKVLDELVQESLLSDQRFAETYIRGRYERGYGPVRIQVELRERGISGSLMAASLGELSPFWADSARRERRKRFGQAFPEDYRERAKQMRFLQQRGFTGDQIRSAFNVDQASEEILENTVRG